MHFLLAQNARPSFRQVFKKQQLLADELKLYMDHLQ